MGASLAEVSKAQLAEKTAPRSGLPPLLRLKRSHGTTNIVSCRQEGEKRDRPAQHARNARRQKRRASGKSVVVDRGRKQRHDHEMVEMAKMRPAERPARQRENQDRDKAEEHPQQGDLRGRDALSRPFDEDKIAAPDKGEEDVNRRG